MSIKENLDKIKGYGSSILADNAFFVGILLVLVSVGSFGLGRLSATSDLPLPLAKESVSQVTIVPPPSVEAIKEEDSVIESTPSPSSPNESTRFLKEPEESLEQGAGESSSDMYVGSKNSDKYHLPWCSGAKRISEQNKVWFQSKEEAASLGYVPAANCPGI